MEICCILILNINFFTKKKQLILMFLMPKFFLCRMVMHICSLNHLPVCMGKKNKAHVTTH